MELNHDDFIRFMQRAEEIGRVEFLHDDLQHVAQIEEIICSEGIMVVVAPNVQVGESLACLVPMRDNGPTHHKFCWRKAYICWIGPVDFDNGKISVCPEEADVEQFCVILGRGTLLVK